MEHTGFESYDIYEPIEQFVYENIFANHPDNNDHYIQRRKMTPIENNERGLQSSNENENSENENKAKFLRTSKYTNDQLLDPNELHDELDEETLKKLDFLHEFGDKINTLDENGIVRPIFDRIPEGYDLYANNRFTGMRTYIDHDNKEIKHVFEGADGSHPEDDMLKWKIVKGDQSFLQSKTYEEVDKDLTKIHSKYSDYNTEMIGYSNGATKARNFAGKYDAKAYLFNAHIMPYTKFENIPTQPIEYHTIISDPTNFKYTLPNNITSPLETHKFYNPKTTDEKSSVSSHFSDQFEPASGDEVRYTPTKYSSTFANAALGALSVADLGMKIEGKQDPKLEETLQIANNIMMTKDLPIYNTAEVFGDETVYFLDKSGITDNLKSNKRKTQDEEIRKYGDIISEKNDIDINKDKIQYLSQDKKTFKLNGKIYHEAP